MSIIEAPPAGASQNDLHSTDPSRSTVHGTLPDSGHAEGSNAPTPPSQASFPAPPPDGDSSFPGYAPTPAIPPRVSFRAQLSADPQEGGVETSRASRTRTLSRIECSTQTDPLVQGFILRTGTQPVLPFVLMVLLAPVVLIISGVSYGEYWSEVYTTAPGTPPIVLSVYVVCLFMGLVVECFVVYPILLSVVAADLPTRTRMTRVHGAYAVFSLIVCLPLAACEMVLFMDGVVPSSAASSKKPVSTVALIVLLVVGVFLLWSVYTDLLVTWIHRVVRRTAVEMIHLSGVAVLHQRPGIDMPSASKFDIMRSSRARGSKRRSLAVDLSAESTSIDTVSRRVLFSP